MFTAKYVLCCVPPLNFGNVVFSRRGVDKRNDRQRDSVTGQICFSSLIRTETDLDLQQYRVSCESTTNMSLTALEYCLEHGYPRSWSSTFIRVIYISTYRAYRAVLYCCFKGVLRVCCWQT